MKKLTIAEHQARVDNLRYASEKVRDCFKVHRVTDYIPGQVVYHLGDRPAKFSLAPDDYDVQLLTRMAENGFEWIQLHEDWRDSVRLHGGNNFRSFDDAGLEKFISLCHSLGLKVIPYISSTFFNVEDPDYREDFARMDASWNNDWLKYRTCWSGSASWRQYNLEHTFETVERYGFDGVYNDMGYDAFLQMYFEEVRRKGRYISHVKEMPYDAEVEDYLSMIYYELKSRGLHYKVHIGDFLPPPCKEKVYDYLWVGEAGESIRNIINCKHFEPYLVPGFDRRTSPMKNMDLPYALTIPFVQFPLLYHGRPIGKQDTQSIIAGIQKYDNPEGHSDNRARKWYLEHPDGPYTYSEWSAIPDDPMEFDRASRYLSLYRPMVEKDSVIRIQIQKADFIRSTIPEQVYISLFTNEKQYLVVSNTMAQPYTVELTDTWKNREDGTQGSSFTVAPESILFLEQIH